MTDSLASDRMDLEIGEIIRETFEIILRNRTTFIPAALLLASLPGAVAGLGRIGAPFLGVLGGLAAIVGAVLLQGALIDGTMSDLQGAPASREELKVAALRFWLPLLGMGFLIGIAVLIGLVLLVVPGVFVALLCSVAGPALVCERLDIEGALRRSIQLTRGRRLQIFVLALIIWVGFAVIEWLLILIAGGWHSPLAAIVASPLINAAAMLIAAVSATILYRRLTHLPPAP